MKKIIMMLLVALLACCATGCTTENKKEDNKLYIVTSFYPMYIATSNIINGVEDVSLTCLASPSVGCLHDYQLTVKDMMTLEGADIFVINGGGMESFLEKAVSSYPALHIVNASEGILEMHEEDHEEGEHHHEENSHIWVSVSMYMEEVKNIAEKLIEYDPQHALIYSNNAENYLKKLENLREEMHEKLDGIPHKNIITFHEAFEFFAEEFHLNILDVIEREPGTYPSAKDIAEIIETVKSKDVSAIFTEPQYSKTAAETISQETNVKVYELDPVVTGEFTLDAYEKAMQKNLDVLWEALR